MTSTYLADKKIMKRFIWRQTYPEGETIVLANGAEGPLWVTITPLGDDPRIGIELEIESNEPDAVDLRVIYEYYRSKDMTWEEWDKNIKHEIIAVKYEKLLRAGQDHALVVSECSGHIPQVRREVKPRITVDAGAGIIWVDDAKIVGLDYEDCLIVKVLVEAKGNWVSSNEMRQSEPHLAPVKRIDRKIDRLQANSNVNVIGNLIERSPKGYRITPSMFV
jgi:hypothetical protein